MKHKKRRGRKLLEVLMLKGMNLMSRRRYEEATDVYKEVISYGHSPYISGAYVNLSQALWLSNLEKTEILDESIALLEKAMEAKPTNQTARLIASNFYLMKGEMDRGILLFSEVTDKSILWQEAQYVKMNNEILYNKSLSNPDELVGSIDYLEKIYDIQKDLSPAIREILRGTYIANKQFQKAYKMMIDQEEQLATKPELLIGYYANASFQCGVLLDNPAEGVTLAKKGIELFKNQPAPYKSKHLGSYNTLVTNLGMSYLLLEQYQNVISLLEPHVKKNPNNSDYQNLGKAYFRLGNYEKGLKYIQCALYISKDEQVYQLKGDIHYHQGEYKDSVDSYLKALSFLNEIEVDFSFEDENGSNIKSILIDEKGTNKEIVSRLIEGYIQIGEYEMAKSLIVNLRKEWPLEESMLFKERNLDKFILHKLKEEEINQNVNRLNQHILEMNKKHQEEMNEVKEWAVNILKIQNNFDDIDSESMSEGDWKVLMKEMHRIAEEMKSELKTSIEHTRIRERFREEFPALSEKGLDFISTAEYLYQVHKDNDIDFAPIVVEYSKVIETEINRILLAKGIVKKKKKWKPLTLGKLRGKVSDEAKLTIPGINEFLSEVIGHRNRSAHTGQSTRTRIDQLRGLLFEKGWLRTILEL